MGAETMIPGDEEAIAVQANRLKQGVVGKTQIPLFSGIPGYRLVHQQGRNHRARRPAITKQKRSSGKPPTGDAASRHQGLQ